jgi:hypothetical protein
MSIISEIKRIKDAKLEIINELRTHDVDVPETCKITDLPNIIKANLGSDVSFITATANDILAGKIGSDPTGKPIMGTINEIEIINDGSEIIVPVGFNKTQQTFLIKSPSADTPTNNNCDFYKCIEIYGPYDVKTVVISGCPTAEANGEYLPTDLVTTDWDGNDHLVYKNSNNWYYYFSSDFMTEGISQDYTMGIYYSGSVEYNDWHNFDTWESFPEMKAIYGTATLDKERPKTWTGYKAVLNRKYIYI